MTVYMYLAICTWVGTEYLVCKDYEERICVQIGLVNLPYLLRVRSWCRGKLTAWVIGRCMKE